MSTDDAGSAAPAPAEISWVRAILTALAILVVGLGVTVFGSQAIITRVTGLSRDAVGYLDSAFFVAAVVFFAWVLRRLQARRLI